MRSEIEKRLHRMESLFRGMQNDQSPASIELDLTENTAADASPQAICTTTAVSDPALCGNSNRGSGPARVINPSLSDEPTANTSGEAERIRPVRSRSPSETSQGTTQLRRDNARSGNHVNLLDQILSGQKTVLPRENNAAVWIRTFVRFPCNTANLSWKRRC
jgi:hypothetical protein